MRSELLGIQGRVDLREEDLHVDGAELMSI